MLIYENRPSKMKLFLASRILRVQKLTLRIITKIDTADSKQGLLTKPILRPYGDTAVMPTAWELNCEI